MTRIPPSLNSAILRKPEALKSLCGHLLSRADLAEFHELSHVAQIAMNSSAANDYLEKIGAEAIGATHLTDKLGPDGRDADGKGVEVKPSKGLFRACVNDDSPMKLLTTSREYSWIVFLNATKDGGRVNWCVVAPYSYWDHERFSGIYKRLGLATDAAWKWGATLPSSPEAKEECLKDLVKFHKPHTYVRSNLLKLNVLKNIPTSEIAFWKHPDVALPLALKGFGGS